ncbi:Uncharacterised protein [Acinetobacter baumannii]|nr:Uncharacterised protein [Acinetobacter baumannii]
MDQTNNTFSMLFNRLCLIVKCLYNHARLIFRLKFGKIFSWH